MKKTYPTVPAGSRVADVPHFDRSQKIKFKCPAHPQSAWASKDPFASSWFPASNETVDCHGACETRLVDYVLVDDYTAGMRA